jgi:diguanylate cyclase (GGDEF)-like protein
MLFFDLDDFKDANDRWGHARGDEILQEVADLIRRSVREVDVPARYGGEEFAVLLPETPRDGAGAVAERIRKAVESHFPATAGARGAMAITISGGVATFPDDAADLDTLLRHADEALYTAKASGKNRVVGTGPERRRHARLPLGEVPLHPHVLLSGTPGRARNISRGGALVEADLALPAGSPVEIRFERTDGGPDLLMPGQVARSNPRDRSGGRVFELGIDFLGAPRLALEELDRLLRSSAQPRAEEV